MLILDKVEKVVSEQGEQLAALHGDEELTYDELWDKSDRLAWWLDEQLGEDKTPVVVFGHKSPLMLICFFACVKSGRAYCPVDISMPQERIDAIIDAVGNSLVLAVEQLQSDKVSVTDKGSILKACGRSEKIDRSRSVKDDDIFYIIFTSGSTGNPKGVQITAENLSRFTDWSVNLGGEAAAKSGKIFLNQAPFSFDLSVMDVYTSLTSGGTLYCLDKEIQSDVGRMLTYLGRGNINFWISTPSFADMCLADKTFDEQLMPDMEAFLFCGETLTRETAASLMKRFPKAKVVNTYGPTESTVAVTGVEITREMTEQEESLPIGRVKPGTDIRLDNGEIVILGDTVSPGYFRDKEKTDKVFAVETTPSGGVVRSYRTGDEGHFDGDMLYYHGRIDLQIKMHGYRIELGDIEANLMRLSGITGAAVVPRRKDGRVRDLAAFIRSDAMEGSFDDRKTIRQQLKEKLPVYMVPKKIVFLDSLPMTGNGKIDRKKLESML